MNTITNKKINVRWAGLGLIYAPGILASLFTADGSTVSPENLQQALALLRNQIG